MTHFFDVSALGLRVRVSFAADTDAAFVQRASGAWVDAILSDAGEPDIDVAVPLPGDEDAILERLSVDVTLAALSVRRGSMFMFHAAGLAAPDGRVVAFVGRSGRGKTTLTRTLAQTYGYVSDETVAIDDDLTVYPYRKPLSLVREGKPKDQVAGSSLGLRALPDHPLRLSALVILDRVEGVPEPRLSRVSLVDVIEELTAQTSYLAEMQQPLQALAALIARVGGLLRVTYSEAEALDRCLDEILSGAVDPLAATELRGVDDCEMGDADSAGLRIAQPTDVIASDEYLILLIDREIRVLGGIAPGLWESIARGDDAAETRSHVLARYGTPPVGDPDALIDGALDELVDTGVLIRGAGA